MFQLFFNLRWNLSGNDGSVQSEQKNLNDDEESENEKAFQTSDEMIVTTKSAPTNGLYESPNHVFMYRTHILYPCVLNAHTIHTTVHHTYTQQYIHTYIFI